VIDTSEHDLTAVIDIVVNRYRAWLDA